MGKYFYGVDTYAARLAIGEIATTIKAKIQFLDRGDIEHQSLTERLAQGATTLFGKTLYVVRDPSSFPKSIQVELVEIKKNITKSECVLWDRIAPDKRSVFWKAFKPLAQEFPIASLGTLAGWLQAQVTQMGGELTTAAAQELVERVGSDRWQLLQEVSKLRMVTEKILPELVKDRVVTRAGEHNAFALLDFIMRGQAKEAMVLLERMIAQGESEFRIMGLLAYQLRALVLVKQGGDTGLQSFVVEKHTRLVGRLSLSFLLDAYARLLATDFSIKQGVVDARTGLVMYVSGILQQLALQPAVVQRN